jgi:hypothetical protein
MTGELVQGTLKLLAANIKVQWDRITRDPYSKIGKRREQVIQELQELYGYTRRQAEHAVDDFLTKVH